MEPDKRSHRADWPRGVDGGVTKSEIQKCATETRRRNAPKTAVCCSFPTRDRREALS